MAHVLVCNDDRSTWVEITQDDESGACRAECYRCATPNLVEGDHEQWSLADTIGVAEVHADKCEGDRS